MAGFDHGRQRGTVHVADHNVSVGKKFFTWGSREFGDVWHRNLTDEDGAYLEIMTGCYTDNQPDFPLLHRMKRRPLSRPGMPPPICRG